MSAQVIVHEGIFQPSQEKTYVHLPFEVPADATRIEVEYSYGDKIGSNPLLTGGNTLDLGVFDARGVDFLAAGFRGWSGSERSSFFITATEATPGYLAGDLMPGQWHVLLGLYKIFAEGCSYHVRITITTAPSRSLLKSVSVPTGDLPASPPRAPFAPWLRGEMHCHSWHSDGDRRAADVVKLARARGLDFLAISDHNTTASQRELAHLSDPGLILIRGVEVTTFKGHFGVWGIPDWVDFRVQRPEQMAAALRFASERGALTACNHPKPFGPPWDFDTVTNFDCVEVWNGPWTLLNQAALDYWVRLLATGRRVPAMCGSDWHRQSEPNDRAPRALGSPTLWVNVPGSPSAPAILDAIRRGHAVLSDEPDGAWLDLRAGQAMTGDAMARPGDGALALQVRCLRGQGNALRLLDQHGVLLERTMVAGDETITAQLSVGDSLYVRAELRTPEDDLKALTNPIYLR